MPCHTVQLPGGYAIVRTARTKPKKCHYCDAAATVLCDYSVYGARRKTTTCDRPCCRAHAKSVGPDRDYCREHGEGK